MDRFARIVLGYHGCEPSFADVLIRGETAISEWKPSENDYDWLGQGIDFWEYGPYRAKNWGKGGVVGAYIQLGECLDLTDLRYTDLLPDEFDAVREAHESMGLALPENYGVRRDLDCLIINRLVDTAQAVGTVFQTVRSPFLEGDVVFPGSRILRESHIQIAVRDTACILGIFRPNLE